MQPVIVGSQERIAIVFHVKAVVQKNRRSFSVLRDHLKSPELKVGVFDYGKLILPRGLGVNLC